MKTKLKICGLTREEDILMVNEIKPDFIGFVFAKSRRQVDLKTALFLKSKLDKNIKSVGVFVNEEIDYIVRAVNSKAIDIIQLHGDENNTYIENLKSLVPTPIIKAIKIKSDIRNGNDSYKASDFLLIDSGSGSGKTFDWSVNIPSYKPLFIAGGIGLENIEEAYKHFKPYAFDLSSSVEVDGFKDFDKMKRIRSKLDKLNGDIYE